MRWKTERETEGIEFYDHLSKVMDTENDLSVGDMVAFTNDYGVIFGPCEVLALGISVIVADVYILTVILIGFLTVPTNSPS